MKNLAKKEYLNEELELSRYAKAMGHPARIVILKYLASLDSCYFGDINKELSISKATVSQHLTELKNSGLIQGSIEPPRVNYCINKENWKKASKLFNDFYNSIDKLKCCQ